jgi:hypothetical protein
MYYSGLKPAPSVASTSRTGAGTITTTTRPGADVCASDCAQDYRCRAYKYSGTTCTLLDSVGTPTDAFDVTKYAGALRSVALPGVGLSGDTILGKSEYVPTVNCGTAKCPVLAEKCRADCESDSTCVAYWLISASITGPLRCTLYSRITEEFELGYRDAGLKGVAAF